MPKLIIHFMITLFERLPDLVTHALWPGGPKRLIIEYHINDCCNLCVLGFSNLPNRYLADIWPHFGR